MKDLTRILYLFLIIIICSNISTAQVFNWAKGIETKTWLSGRPSVLALDSARNIYTTSYFIDTVSFGNFQLYSIGEPANYLAKYNQDGTFLWAKKYPASYEVNIAVDKSGNSYLGGKFYNTGLFDTIQLTSFGGADVFIAKYDPNGNCIWAKHAGSNHTDYVYGICLDSHNNCFITGYFEGAALFGSFELTSFSEWEFDIYIAKYDSSGNCLWAKREGASGDDCGHSVATDIYGNSYILATTPAPGYYMRYIYLAKYNSEGTRVWERSETAGEESGHYSICKDIYDNLLIAGTFGPSATFGSFVLVSDGPSDIFIVKYDPQGNCLWAKKAGGVNSDDANSIITDQFGYITITGRFTGTANFGNLQLTACGNNINYFDGYVARYDPNGNCIWVKQIASTGNDGGSDVFVDNNGDSFISGYYHTNTYFGDITLMGPGLFVAKMPPNPTPVELTSLTARNKNTDVILNWSTATETNNRGFEIQRRIINGEFAAIGFIKGYGTTTEVKTYSFIDKNPPGGKYNYRLKQVDFNGNSSISDVVEIDIVTGYSLEQNYPNPFNPVTTISYSLPYSQHVTIEIFDVLGNKITTLVNEEKAPGNYNIVFNGNDLSSGIYFYQLKAGSFKAIKKCVFIK